MLSSLCFGVFDSMTWKTWRRKRRLNNFFSTSSWEWKETRKVNSLSRWCSLCWFWRKFRMRIQFSGKLLRNKRSSLIACRRSLWKENRMKVVSSVSCNSIGFGVDEVPYYLELYAVQRPYKDHRLGVFMNSYSWTTGWWSHGKRIFLFMKSYPPASHIGLWYLHECSFSENWSMSRKDANLSILQMPNKIKL